MMTLPFLVDDRVESHSSLSGLTVPDNEFTLAAANGNHGVNRFQPSLQRLLNRLAVDDSWSNPLDGIKLLCDDGPFPIDRLPESVDDSTDDGISNGHGNDPFRSLNEIPFLISLVSPSKTDPT
jgi:hypothetical protein